MNNRDHQSQIEQEHRTVSYAFLDIYGLIFHFHNGYLWTMTVFGYVSLHYDNLLLTNR